MFIDFCMNIYQLHYAVAILCIHLCTPYIYTLHHLLMFSSYRASHFI